MPEFAITGSPVRVGQAANPSRLIVRFYQREIPLIERFPIWPGQMGGKPVEGKSEFVDYVQISHPGENLNCIDRRATEDDQKRFPHEWERYHATTDNERIEAQAR